MSHRNFSRGRGRGSWGQGGRQQRPLHHHQAPGEGNNNQNSLESVIPSEYIDKVRSFGTSPEDIARWREERRRRFPRRNNNPQANQSFSGSDVAKDPSIEISVNDLGNEENKRLKAIASHFAAYGSDDEEEDPGPSIPAPSQPVEAMNNESATDSLLTSARNESMTDNAMKSSKNDAKMDNQNPRPEASIEKPNCSHFSKFGTCKYGDRCRYAHNITETHTNTSRRSAMSNIKMRSQTELLEAVMRNEMVEERKTLLECFAYIVENNFFT